MQARYEYRQKNITPELLPEIKVRDAGFPPLKGTRMIVCVRGGETIAEAFVLLQGGGLLLLYREVQGHPGTARKLPGRIHINIPPSTEKGE